MNDSDSRRPGVTVFRAAWVVPGIAPPIRDGFVRTEQGRIVAVGSWQDIRPSVDAGAPSESVVELGEVAILPGLINAHTHLEYSVRVAPFGRAGTPFVEWLADVIAAKRATADDDPNEVSRLRTLAIHAGRHELTRGGTTIACDIATPWPSTVEPSSATPNVSPDAAIESDWPPGRRFQTGRLVCRELLGLSPDRVGPLAGLARSHCEEPFPLTPGISPHAPYTVHPQLLRQAVQVARTGNHLVAMHVAESEAEVRLLKTGDGPLVDLLQSLGAWRPDAIGPGTRPGDVLAVLADAPRSLVVHGRYLDREEIAYLAARRDRMAVVYCPRTDAFFQPGRSWPLEEMRDAGVKVVLGTDSRASNPNLSIWEEARFVRQAFPNISPMAIVRMVTVDAAEALGLAGQWGEIAVGRAAVMTAMALPSEILGADVAPGDLLAALLEGPETPRLLEPV